MISSISSLPPFWVHIVLLGGDVIATIAVGWGIIWEAPEYPPSYHEIAKRLVIWGIVAETLCSIFIFTFDESVSSSQQGKIIALETQLESEREARAPRSLTKAQYDAIQKLRGKVAVIRVGAENEVDCQQFESQIITALIHAGIKVNFLNPAGMMGTGNTILVEKDFPNPETDPLAHALRKAGLLGMWGDFPHMPWADDRSGTPALLVVERPLQYVRLPYFAPAKDGNSGEKK
jgi:hypothetical protein